jgi:hypothetical protein
MALLTLRRTTTTTPPELVACRPRLNACRFERALLPGQGLVLGGILTCLQPDGGPERRLHVAMTWDVLAELRSALDRAGFPQPDELIIRSVLLFWGRDQYSERLRGGVCLPAEGLILNCLGGPCSDQARKLLEASGLLPARAA